MPASSSTAHASSGWCGWRRSTRQENSMSSRSAAKMARPASKPVSKSSARKRKAKLAKVTQFPTAWLRRGHVRKLGARFIKIVWPGDELTCRGCIAELRKENGAFYADVELWAENQKGELVLRGQATCELYESPQNGGGEGGGLLFALQQSGPAVPPGQAKKSSPPSKPPKKK